jgi:acyl dehydratase
MAYCRNSNELATKARPRPLGPHPLIGIGVDELRWLMAVRPGDVLHLEGEIVSLARSKTKPLGTVRIRWTLYKQAGEPVHTFTPIAICPTRPILA